VLTDGRQRYFMTLIDDASRYCYVYLLKTKNEALNCFKTYKGEVKNQLEKKIKRFRSDRGGEYFSNEFDLFCAKHGIIHERTPPYSPQLNVVVERKNRRLPDLVNSILVLSWLYNHESTNTSRFCRFCCCAAEATSSHSLMCICDRKSRFPEPSSSAILHRERANKVFRKRSS
jgi:transposase InsO family protein